MPTAIHRRVQNLRSGKHDPNLIARLPTGWAILGDRQPEQLLGCCTILCDIQDHLLGIPESTGQSQTSHELHYRRTPAHLTDLPLSPIDLQSAFFSDIARLARAVTRATACERVNILLLCNQVQALHAHIVPRYATEDPAKRIMDPFCAYDFASSPQADTTANSQHAQLRTALQHAISA